MTRLSTDSSSSTGFCSDSFISHNSSPCHYFCDENKKKKKTKAGTIGKNSQEDWYRTPGKTWKTAQHCTFHSESKTCPNKISNCVRSMFIPAIADHKRSMIKNYVHDSCYFPLLAGSRTDSGIIVCAIHWKGRHSENNLGGHRWPGIQKHRRQVKISMS